MASRDRNCFAGKFAKILSGVVLARCKVILRLLVSYPCTNKIVLAECHPPACCGVGIGAVVIDVIEFDFVIGIIESGGNESKIGASKTTRVAGVIKIAAFDLSESVCAPFRI